MCNQFFKNLVPSEVEGWTHEFSKSFTLRVWAGGQEDAYTPNVHEQ